MIFNHSAVMGGEIWRLLTYPVVNLRVISFLLAVFFLFNLVGEVEASMERKEYLKYIFISVISGSLFGVILSGIKGGNLSGFGLGNIVWSMVALRCFLDKDRLINVFGIFILKQIHLILFFIIILLLQSLFEGGETWVQLGAIFGIYLSVEINQRKKGKPKKKVKLKAKFIKR